LFAALSAGGGSVLGVVRGERELSVLGAVQLAVAVVVLIGFGVLVKRTRNALKSLA
jgi:hypothetical protein